MENLEISAKTVDKAIQQALEQLGVTREEVEVTVLSEGKTGILGLGGEEARIRVKSLVPMPERQSDVTETAKNTLETLLSAMGFSASVEPCDKAFVVAGQEATTPIAFDIKGDDLGILIGRRGQTLASLQYIVRLIVAQKIKVWEPIVIDVEGYKQRRHQALQALAYRIAERVKDKKAPFTLEPMPAYERRIIHLSLTDHPDVTTQSIGEGESRKVVISPRKQ